MVTIDRNNEISEYFGELTIDCIARNNKKIQQAFPKIKFEFFKLLNERIRDLGKCDAWFDDAVNHVIDTCKYPQPMIANFLEYDKKIKLFTYNQMIAKIEDGNVWDDFKKIVVNNKNYWTWKR